MKARTYISREAADNGLDLHYQYVMHTRSMCLNPYRLHSSILHTRLLGPTHLTQRKLRHADPAARRRHIFCVAIHTTQTRFFPLPVHVELDFCHVIRFRLDFCHFCRG